LDLTVVDLGLLPAEELVGDVVLLADVAALLLLVTEGVSVSDGVWLPLVGGWLVSIIVVELRVVLDLALDWADGPDVLVIIGAFQVAAPFLLDWTLVGSAHGLHALDFVEFTAEVVALDIFIKVHG